MKVKEVLDKSVQFLRDRKVESPRLETELLMASVLKTNRIGIYLKFEAPLTETELSALRELVVRKSKGEPTAYLIGSKYFGGRSFHVGPGVLIPRPETELILEQAVKYLKESSLPDSLLVADLGAGSGCLGLSIGLECPNCKIALVEKSPQAIYYTQTNLKELISPEMQMNFTLINKAVEDWSPSESFDLIVANPPYIAFDDKEVCPSVRTYEPAEALFAEDDGLAAIHTWMKQALKILKPGGLCFFEVGYRQGLAVQNLFVETGEFALVEIIQDFNKQDRIIKAVKNG